MKFEFRVANDINTGTWIIAEAEAETEEKAREIIRDRFNLPEWHSIPLVRPHDTE